MIYRRFVSLVGASLVAGCLAAHADTPNQLRAEWIDRPCPLGLPPPISGSQHAGVGAVLLAAVAPKLIEGGVDMAAKALTAAGEAKEEVLETHTSGFYYVSKHDGENLIHARCLIVVEAPTFDAGVPPEAHTQWTKITASLKIFTAPRMIFMAAVQPVPEGKFVTLQPAYLELNGARNSGFFFSGEKRDYNFAIAMDTPGATKPFASPTITLKGIPSNGVYDSAHPLLQRTESPPIPMPEVSAPGQAILKKLAEIWAPKIKAASILDRHDQRSITRPRAPPSLYESNSPTSIARRTYCDALNVANDKRPKSSFVAEPICDFEVTNARAALAKALSDMEISDPQVKWAYEICYEDITVREVVLKNPPPTGGHSCQVPEHAVKLGKKTYSFFTTRIVSSEIRPGSNFAKLLGDALSASKADVSKALASKMLPLTDAQKSAEAEDERAARRSVLEADLTVEAAEATLASTPDTPVAEKTQAKLAVLKAKFAANDAYRRSGRVPPYPEAD